MRILILSGLFPNPWQPHRATFNRQQFAALAEQHRVHVIAPVSWTDELRSKQPQPHTRTFVRDGLTVEHPRYFFTPLLFRERHGQFYRRSVRRAFERAVETVRPDVVLASWAYPDAWAATELCERARLPLVVKVHGSDVLLPAAGSVRRAQTAEALQLAAAVVAVSKQLAGAVCELGVAEDRVHVVYNGVDSTIFHPACCGAARTKLKLSPEPLVLFAGNLVAVKGLEVLIAACARLREAGVSFQCRLIGQGPLQRPLEQQIAAAGLAEQVKLLGARPLEQLPDWYRAASVFVLPSRSEGVPNVILEAMACGTPVVATRVGGIPEILDAASLVAPDDPAALAQAITLALSQPRVALRDPGTWAHSAARLAEVLQGAIAGRAKAAA